MSVIDSSLGKNCYTCVHGDSCTTFCHERKEYVSQDQYESFCEKYVSIIESIQRHHCPICGGVNVIFDDVDESNEQAFIECNDCGFYVCENNRQDVLERWNIFD